jgi:hypothetical protein
MTDTVKSVAAHLRGELDQIAAEKGVTVVTTRARHLRGRYSLHAPDFVRALRLAGYWSDENGSGIWRAIAGAALLEIGTTEDGTTNGARGAGEGQGFATATTCPMTT